MARQCTIPECTNKYFGRGWCNKHWQRWRAHGDPLTLTTLQTLPLRERFKARVDRSGGPDACHEWTGARHRQGYGITSAYGQRKSAHHAAWFLAEGYWPKYLLHSCDNPPCVNRRHLSEGTHLQNMREATERNRRNFDNPLFGEARAKKLTRDIAREIFTKFHEGAVISALTDEYGLSPATVHRIAIRKLWRRDTADLASKPINRIERLPRGESHPRAKASFEVAEMIRVRVAQGERRKALALEYGLSPSVVQRIITGEQWLRSS